MNDNIDTTLPFGGAFKHEHSGSAPDSGAVVMFGTFQEFWQEHGSLDYDEMCQAKAAWDYQQKRLSNTNKDFAAQLLFQDPETGEELRPACAPKDECGGIAIYVANKDGNRTWKHTIHTEEI